MLAVCGGAVGRVQCGAWVLARASWTSQPPLLAPIYVRCLYPERRNVGPKVNATKLRPYNACHAPARRPAPGPGARRAPRARKTKRSRLYGRTSGTTGLAAAAAAA
eukprot:scaffold42872_cov61-Phaeocystis_antarctica.AAC.2